MTYVKCTKCNKEIEGLEPTLPFIPFINTINNDNVVYYENRPFHRDCLPSYLNTNTKFNDLIHIDLDVRASDILSIITNLQQYVSTLDKATRKLLVKFSNIMCEQNSDYIMCANPECKKLILRSSAIIGEKTKSYQSIVIRQQAESELAPDDKDYKKNGIAHKVLYFCSSKCDGYFSSKLHNTLQNFLNIAKKQIVDIDDRVQRSITIYETSSTRSKEEIDKVKKAFVQQAKAKKEIVTRECMKKIKDETKRTLGIG